MPASDGFDRFVETHGDAALRAARLLTGDWQSGSGLAQEFVDLPPPRLAKARGARGSTEPAALRSSVVVPPGRTRGGDMTDQMPQERIKALGHSGEAPAMDPNSLIAAGDRRRTSRRAHRTLAAGAALAVPASIWALSNLGPRGQTSPAPRRVAAAGTTTPSAAAVAPACPPSGPQLVIGPESDAPALTGTITARAGDSIRLFGLLPAHNRPDAPVTSVTFIIGTRQFLAAPEGNPDLAEPVTTRTLASVQVTPTSRLAGATLTIPASTPPGAYLVVVSYTFPSPSLCGRPNDPHAPTLGRAWSRQGTLTVLPDTGRS